VGEWLRGPDVGEGRMSGRERRLDAIAARIAKLKVPRRLEDQFGKYRNDPVGFCREVLGVTSATRRSTGEAYQFAILGDLVDHARVAAQTGHGVGKTATDGWVIPWWLVTRPFSRVIVLAPEFSRQIVAVLFSECRKWVRRARVKLPLKVMTSRVLVEGYGEEWSATGMSTAGDPGRIEGFHAEGGVLVIVDEMKAVPQDAFDAIQGALTNAEDSRLLVTSVPGGGGSGPFWKACQDTRRWKIHHVPSTDSSIVSPEWIEDRAKDWGVGSPLYECRVLGRFADAGEGVLFPLALLEAAMTRPASKIASVGIGVDVARSVAGDLNCVAKCQDGVLSIVKTWRSPDTMVTTEKVLHIVTETGLSRLAVDVGGPGGGVHDRLRQLGYESRGVAFGGGADEKTRFKNKRAELFWNLRDALEKGTVNLADDDELRADLSALRYVFTQDGKIQIESKDEVRTRLGRSPDRADALALALSVALPRNGSSNTACAVGVPKESGNPFVSGGGRPWTGMRHDDAGDSMRPLPTCGEF
jgi:phage terminase large subunit-like protein